MDGAKRSWNNMGNSTRIAIIVAIVAVIILVILCIVRAMRNKKRLESASKSESSSSSTDRSSFSVQTPKQETAAVPPAPVPQAQPRRVVGSAGIVQATCGGDPNCDGPVLKDSLAGMPSQAAHSQRLGQRAAAQARQSGLRPQSKIPQEAASKIASKVRPTPQVRAPKQARVNQSSKKTEENVDEEGSTQKSVEQVTAPKTSRFSVKNDDE